jgi:hypothetical protein
MTTEHDERIAQLKSALARNDITIDEYTEAVQDLGKPRPLTCKVSAQKGGCSVYGMNGPFPVTLYPAQWRRLFDNTDSILAFLTEHESEFSVKK